MHHRSVYIEELFTYFLCMQRASLCFGCRCLLFPFPTVDRKKLLSLVLWRRSPSEQCFSRLFSCKVKSGPMGVFFARKIFFHLPNAGGARERDHVTLVADRKQDDWSGHAKKLT